MVRIGLEMYANHINETTERNALVPAPRFAGQSDYDYDLSQYNYRVRLWTLEIRLIARDSAANHARVSRSRASDHAPPLEFTAEELATENVLRYINGYGTPDDFRFPPGVSTPHPAPWPPPNREDYDASENRRVPRYEIAEWQRLYPGRGLAIGADILAPNGF